MNGDSGGAAHDLNQETTPAPTSIATTPGELLRTARQDRNLSIQQVADDLHLDVRAVQALESNAFASLGPPVYSRGYLRKYATVVGLAPDDVIAHYDRLNDVPEIPAPIPASIIDPPPERRSFKGPLMAVAGIAAISLVVWVVSELLNRPASNSAPITTSALVSPPQPSDPAPAAPVATSTMPPIESRVEGAPPPAATPQSAPAVPGKGVTMRLRFAEASWVEIYDAGGRRLLYEIGQPGQERSLAGEPPLRVTLGLASAVSMDVNGRTVPVPRRAGKDSARFTIAADGAAQ